MAARFSIVQMSLIFARPLGRSLLAGIGLAACAPGARATDTIPIKVIVRSGSEVGEDTGDAPGEFQYWYEREMLFDRIELPGAAHPLCRNAEGPYGDVGVTKGNPKLSPVTTIKLVLAICLDPRFDPRKTYWLVNGIAGIDPASGPIGSAVWSENVVDGDAMREIDEAEMPAGWRPGDFLVARQALMGDPF